jgi:adenylosuccinate synthase
MRAYAVIGANYGDEGKGRTVDWLSAPFGSDALVVRSNGGAQAGHTVVSENGARHVFHHFGSGTLCGAATHLSRFMASHPMLFLEEQATLARLGAAPRVSADPRGYVTTPWDMMVNQAVEVMRGGGRHGSCGLGYGETIGRCEETGHSLTVGDLGSAMLRDKLLSIRAQWLPERLAALGVDPGCGPLEFAGSDALLDHFVDQCSAFVEAVALRSDATIAEAGRVIFEGAQGLLLDQNGDGFPFVTRSNTGLANILAIADEAGIDTLDTVYATRCYLTRHGRGPMEDERAIDRWFLVEDATNRPNAWQETLRFGLLDPARLHARIAADLARAAGRATVRPLLAVSCLDQARGQLAWIADGRVDTGAAADLVGALEAATGLRLTAAFSSDVNLAAAAPLAASRNRGGQAVRSG